jgi:hypothetical protein
MKKPANSRRKRKDKRDPTRSVDRILQTVKYPEADTALELVEVYEAVERNYRAAVMAGEVHAGVAYSTN